MATAAASRSIGLFQRAFGELKSSASRALNTASELEASKPKRRKKKNLFDVAHFLPNWGIGHKMCKSSWRDLSYEITKINLYKDGRHGKAWGIRCKAGEYFFNGLFCWIFILIAQFFFFFFVL